MQDTSDLPTGQSLQYSVLSDLATLRLRRAYRYLVKYRHFGIPSHGARRMVFEKIVPKNRPSLEIAPYHNPFLDGDHVKTFDVLDAEGLRAQAHGFGVSPERIRDVDYVSATGDLSIIPDKFDVVYSSHCGEHTPDIVGHFNQVADLLNPGGRYYMFLPDKRFCFDHFLPESSIADVLAAHVEGRQFHIMRSLLAARTLHTHNDALRHWKGDHGKPSLDQEGFNLAETVSSIEATKGTYVDTHAWQFTPDGFRQIFEALADLGYCRLRPLRVYGTYLYSHEFAVVLGASEAR